jgi:hypothetical protein
MTKQAKDLLVAGLAAGAAAVAVWFAFAARSPKIDLDAYAVLGAVTAEETAKLLASQGRVLVIARDTGPDKNPSVEAALKAFGQTLRQHRGLRQVTERVVVPPMQMMATGGGVPAEQLFKALEAHPGVGALVLFCALPPLTESELETLKRYGVKIVVTSSFHPAYGRLLEQQAIHLVIAPRPGAPPPATGPARTLRERFDQDYMIVTPAN